MRSSVTEVARTRRGALVALLVGLALTLVAAFVVHGVDRRRDQRQFELRAQLVGEQLQRELVTPLEVVYALASLFEASDDVTAEEFAAFAEPALTRRTAIETLGWVPRVPQRQRTAFEARMRRRHVGYEIREPGAASAMLRAADREVHFPVTYLQPMHGDILGFDLAFDERRRSWIQRAAASGEVFVTPRYTLVHAPEGTYAVAAYAAVYERGARKGSLEEREAGLRGVVVGIFRLEAALAAATAAHDAEGMAIVLRDRDAGQNELLYSSVGHDVQPQREHGQWERALPIGERSWQVAIHGTEPLGSVAPLVVLIVGLTASVVLALVLHGAHRLRRQVVRLGQYVLHERIGEGGMGAVYRAQHALLRRPTAIKLIREDLGATEIAQQRFEREVQAVSELSHPNTIVLYDYGRTPDGILYYAMEYAPGIDLHALVRRFGPVPPGRVVHILAQVCGSLAEAHGRGLVHRDMKPANVMLCVRGGVHDFVKVLDFGLVLVAEPEAGAARLSGELEILGTPHFMAPEQTLDPSEVGPAADVYAVGGIAYFLLTGRHVFDGRNAVEVCMKHMSTEPPPPSTRTPQPIPPELEAIVLRCLAKKPADRPSSIEALRKSLVGCAGVTPWTAADAAAWWACHPDVVGEPSPVGAPTQVLAVDVGQRTAPLPLAVMATPKDAPGEAGAA